MFHTLRTTIPADARGTYYATASAIVPALVTWGILTEDAAPAVTGVIIAAITLLFALVHSDSPWRQALYGLMAATGTLGAYLGWGTEAQFGAILAIIAPALGIGTAAYTTNPNTETHQ